MTSLSNRYVLDTTILVLYARWSKPAQRIESTFGLITSLDRPLICEVSIGEIRSLTLKLGWGITKIQYLQNFLLNLLTIDISNEDIYNAYADLDNFARLHGFSIGKNDLWIAAAAKVTNSVLITGDKDFDVFSNAKLSRILVDITTGSIIST